MILDKTIVDSRLDDAFIEYLKSEVTEYKDLFEIFIDILEQNIDANSLDEIENIKVYLEEAYPITGAVSGLIYYSETHKIFAENFEEIFDYISEYDECFIDNLKSSDSFNANGLVWAAWETWIYTFAMSKFEDFESELDDIIYELELEEDEDDEDDEQDEKEDENENEE